MKMLCPLCFHVRRLTELMYNLQCDWYVCRIHGPVNLAEELPRGVQQ